MNTLINDILIYLFDTFLYGRINKSILSLVSKRWNLLLKNKKYKDENTLKDFTDTNHLTEELYLFLKNNKTVKKQRGNLLGNLIPFNTKYCYDPVCDAYAYVKKNNIPGIEHIIITKYLLHDRRNKMIFGNVQALEMHKRYQHIHPFVSEMAALSGSLDALKWLSSHGYLFDEKVFHAAVENGNLDNIIWLYNEGCAYDYSSITAAEKKGDTTVIEWLNKNCNFPPYTSSTFLNNYRFYNRDFFRSAYITASSSSWSLGFHNHNSVKVPSRRKNNITTSNQIFTHAKICEDTCQIITLMRNNINVQLKITNIFHKYDNLTTKNISQSEINKFYEKNTKKTYPKKQNIKFVPKKNNIKKLF